MDVALSFKSQPNMSFQTNNLDLLFYFNPLFFLYVPMNIYGSPLKRVCARETWPGQWCLRAQLFQIAHIFGKKTLIKHCVFPQLIAIYETFKKNCVWCPLTHHFISEFWQSNSFMLVFCHFQGRSQEFLFGGTKLQH